MLLLCFVALLSVNGTYATDGNTSNISNNITSINDTELTSFTEETTTIENISTENTTVNVTENSTDNSDTTDNTTDNVTSTSSESGAAGDASTGETLDNVESLFVWSTSLSTINPTSLVNAGITDVYVYVPRTNIAVIQSFIEKFSGTGIRVWAWIPCFVDSDGNWLIAGESTINGEDSREWLKDEIDSIASTYGISGVLLDYCRYPGTAYKHPTEEEATAIITNFVSDVRSMLDTIGGTKGSYIYLGIAVMPECSVNTYYYGQSYEQLSQYVDCLIPMVYKGNYGEDSSWIGTVTSYIVSHSTVPVITAVQTYESDSNTTPLSSSELTTDVQTAVDNGSSGYALFRYGLISSYPVITIPVSLTIEEILEASEIVKNYIETNKKLPTTITIGTHNINMAQFLYLATKATVALNNGQSTATSITVGSYTLPSTSYENLKTGALTTGTYVDFANRIAQYIAESSQAPPYGIIGLGEISYQSQVYLYSRVLTSYKNNGQLPNTMTVKTWTTSNIPITEPTSYTFTIDQILTAAQTVKTYIETNKKLPTTVTIGTTSINMAQFLFLAAAATNDLNKGNPTTTTVTVSSNYQLPSSSSESLKTGTLTTSNYVDFANRIAQYMAENYQAPPYGLIGLGQISYQSQIYLYSRVLSSYKNNGQLPSSITLKSWSTSNIPITEPMSFTIAEVLTAAQTVKNYIETNKTLPTTITIGTTSINMAQFLYLATQATVALNNGKSTTTTVTTESYTLPTSSIEELDTELLFSADYVDLASRISEFISNNQVAPTYGLSSIGKIGYKSQIYLFSRILDYYKTNKVLPSNIVVKTWSTSNIPTTGINVSFSIDDIADTATGVKNNVELYSELPTTANVAGVRINIAQFLYLATVATVQIKSNNDDPISLDNYNVSSSSYENMSSGNLSLAEYLDFASRIAQYMAENKETPSYGVVSLGDLSYHTQIYLFSRVLDQYNTNGALPSSISLQPWVTVIYGIPAEYSKYMVATTNCQSDNSQIIALANSITSSASTAYEKAVAIFNWVRDNIGYSFYYNTKYGAVGTLSAGSGNCVDTSHLLIALLRAASIPARYVHGYCNFSSGSWYGHVWAEVYVNGQWYSADASSSRNTFGVINSWNTATATIYNRYATLPF